MSTTQVANTEHVARLLKPVWVSARGSVSAIAFTLRPKMHETYISVLRESVSTFEEEATRIAHWADNIPYASIGAKELNDRTDHFGNDTINYSVLAVDNKTIKSHAGIFIAVNGNNVVGGEPFESFAKKQGVPEEAILMDVSKKLAALAQTNIKYLNKKK